MWFPHGRAHQLVVSTTWSALKTYVQETFRQTPQVIYIPLYCIQQQLMRKRIRRKAWNSTWEGLKGVRECRNVFIISKMKEK